MHPSRAAHTSTINMVPYTIKDLHPSVTDTYSRSIVDGIFSIIDHGIAPNIVEVLLKLAEHCVLMLLDLLTHRTEIHRMTNNIEIVWNLKEREKERVSGWVSE